MRFTTSLFTAALIATTASLPIKRADPIDPKLVPQLGVKAGVNPTGTGDCDGVNGVKIPCTCPPDQQKFVSLVQKNVDAGKVVNNPSVPFSFPTGNSTEDQLARINAATVTLQNIDGPGKGCPQASTTLGAQEKAIQAGGAADAAAAPAANAAAAPATNATADPAANATAAPAADAAAAAAANAAAAPATNATADPAVNATAAPAGNATAPAGNTTAAPAANADASPYPASALSDTAAAPSNTAAAPSNTAAAPSDTAAFPSYMAAA